MRNPSTGPVLARSLAALSLVCVLGGALVACGGPAPSPSATPSGPPATTVAPATSPVDPTPVMTTAPELTPVPGATDEPIPPAGGGGTTVIGWGTILDQVPEDFPLFPGASPAEIAEGPNSGAWFAEGAAADEVATWYRDRLEALGFETMDLSSPLEDGSRVLDTVSDLPECRIQTTFRPADGSTMIIVLYGAGCAGGDG